MQGAAAYIKDIMKYAICNNGFWIDYETGVAFGSSNALATRPLVNDLTSFHAMFCGKRGDTRVETGLGGTSYGWWYTYADEEGSTIDRPFGLDEDGSFVWPSVLPTAGIKGKAIFKGSNPYAALSFDLVDGDDTPANINSWGGVCVVYNSNGPIKFAIKPSNEVAVTGYNNPAIILPSSNSKNVILDASWSDFKQDEGWGIEGVATSTVMANASKAGFTFTGTAGGSTSFIIYAFGKKGTCE